ncbi:MAG TPA: methylaspartate mutase subunit E, partial [Candidatus Riflebacteria bacterium]|nr:methylaspartate mutase subunit E [Candidatus Riflebacteria bacterium]
MLSLDSFNQIRSEILETWPTGRGLSLEDGIAYQKKIPEAKNFAVAMRKASAAGITLL